MQSDMYWRGFDHGEDHAICCCFGGSKMETPVFATDDEMIDYEDGFEDGFDSVD